LSPRRSPSRREARSGVRAPARPAAPPRIVQPPGPQFGRLAGPDPACPVTLLDLYRPGPPSLRARCAPHRAAVARVGHGAPHRARRPRRGQIACSWPLRTRLPCASNALHGLGNASEASHGRCRTSVCRARAAPRAPRVQRAPAERRPTRRAAPRRARCRAGAPHPRRLAQGPHDARAATHAGRAPASAPGGGDGGRGGGGARGGDGGGAMLQRPAACPRPRLDLRSAPPAFRHLSRLSKTGNPHRRLLFSQHQVSAPPGRVPRGASRGFRETEPPRAKRASNEQRGGPG
jgi:hypothetical protein